MPACIPVHRPSHHFLTSPSHCRPCARPCHCFMPTCFFTQTPPHLKTPPIPLQAPWMALPSSPTGASCWSSGRQGAAQLWLGNAAVHSGAAAAAAFSAAVPPCYPSSTCCLFPFPPCSTNCQVAVASHTFKASGCTNCEFGEKLRVRCQHCAAAAGCRQAARCRAGCVKCGSLGGPVVQLTPETAEASPSSALPAPPRPTTPPHHHHTLPQASSPPRIPRCRAAPASASRAGRAPTRCWRRCA